MLMKHQRPSSTLKQEISSIELFSNARGEIRVSSLLQLIRTILRFCPFKVTFSLAWTIW